MNRCLAGCWPQRPPVQVPLTTGAETWAWSRSWQGCHALLGKAEKPGWCGQKQDDYPHRTEPLVDCEPTKHTRSTLGQRRRRRANCVERALHFQPWAWSQAAQLRLPRPILSCPCPWGHLWNPSRQPDILSAYTLGPATACLPGTWSECTPASGTTLAVTSQDVTVPIPVPSS